MPDMLPQPVHCGLPSLLRGRRVGVIEHLPHLASPGLDRALRDGRNARQVEWDTDLLVAARDGRLALLGPPGDLVGQVGLGVWAGLEDHRDVHVVGAIWMIGP